MAKTLVKLFAIIFLFASTSGEIGAADDSKPFPPEAVPLVRLLVLPDQYSGKEVTTFGLLKIEFKEDILYMSRDDAENFVALNGLSLNFKSRAARDAVSRYSGKVVMIRGRFEPPSGAFVEVTSGSLLDISEVVPADEWIVKP